MSFSKCWETRLKERGSEACLQQPAHKPISSHTTQHCLKASPSLCLCAPLSLSLSLSLCLFVYIAHVYTYIYLYMYICICMYVISVYTHIYTHIPYICICISLFACIYRHAQPSIPKILITTRGLNLQHGTSLQPLQNTAQRRDDPETGP